MSELPNFLLKFFDGRRMIHMDCWRTYLHLSYCLLQLMKPLSILKWLWLLLLSAVFQGLLGRRRQRDG